MAKENFEYNQTENPLTAVPQQIITVSEEVMAFLNDNTGNKIEC